MPQEPEYLQTAKGGKRYSDEFRPILDARRFILLRWHGEAPLVTVFWRDMILIGTLINVVATLAMIALLANEVPTIVALAVFFLPLPWNFFLTIAVWRCATRAGGPLALAAQMGSALWLLVAITL